MTSSPNTVAVVGAGQMGSGIGHVLALAGVDVRLYDVDAGRLENALASIGTNLERQVRKGSIEPAQRGPALARIRLTTSLSDFGEAEAVIEAVPESESVKRTVYAEMEPHLSKSAIIATNTSSLSITRLASWTGRPDRVIGLHFFNPVPTMGLVEVIRGLQTADATHDWAISLVAKLGKRAALSRDTPGFIANRLLIPFVNEAAFLLEGGVADIATIDLTLKLGANHPMGPLTLADFIGLDICLAAMRVLHAGLGEAKYRPCPLLIQMVDAGWLGRKSGTGFYVYSDAAPHPNPSLVPAALRWAAAGGLTADNSSAA